jgi:hypothetical protein
MKTKNTKRRTRRFAALAFSALAAGATACHEEGPAERAGRHIDEAAEESEGALEELGREVGEAADESKEAADEIRDAAS